MIKIGGQFSGVGAFDFALDRLGIDYENVYQSEWGKYERVTYLANHSTPDFYIKDVKDTPILEITDKYGSLDIAMFSPPCQSFSLAGKRSGKDDLKGRGVLFFNSLEFIEINKPRFFIFENVKGLLSDDKKDKNSDIGKTFSEWLNLLGGKSINGDSFLFPYEGSVPYHIYWEVLNSKDYGVPQNRERVFIVGIRDDQDNVFSWPKKVPLIKRLKDVLEDDVDEKYYLSERLINNFINKPQKENYPFNPITDTEKQIACTLKASYYKMGATDNYIKDTKPIVVHNLTGGKWDKTHEQSRRVYDVEGVAPSIHTCGGGNQEPKILQLNLSIESNGRQPYQQNRVYDSDGIIPSLCQGKSDLNVLERKDIHNCITSAIGRAGSSKEYLDSVNKISMNIQGNRIRKLTPLECFRLMDFPDSLVEKARNEGVSNSQLYKQAGNSIVVGVLALIIKNLKIF